MVLRAQALHLPTFQQMWSNAQQIEEKYKLPGFGFGGVDGTFLCFDGKPKYVCCPRLIFQFNLPLLYTRRLPPNRIAKTFFGRKYRYAINAQVDAGLDKLIYDLNLGSPGKFTDSITTGR